MFQGYFKEILRVLKGRLRGVPRNCQGCFKGTSSQFQKRFKQVSRVFEESIECVSKKSNKKGCFNVVLFCNFVVAWISSQLPEQKEGLFFHF